MKLNELVKQRLVPDRPSTSITIRIPQDVVDSMKRIAPHRGLPGYQTLLKMYVSEGLRKDEATFSEMSNESAKSIDDEGEAPGEVREVLKKKTRKHTG